ncbi:MAG: DUF1287 domain-containing protein [Myxococcota bacterium]
MAARRRVMPVVTYASRARRRHPLLFLMVLLALAGGVGWLWYSVFSPLFEDPRDWVARERAFRRALNEVLTGDEGESPAPPELPDWPAPGDVGARLVICAEAQVARGVRVSGGYHAMDYPWGDVPAHLGASSDLVVRCLREVGIDLQQMIHLDRVGHPRRYPLHLWANKRPDTAIDHRRLPNLWTFLETFGETHGVRVDSMDRRADFLPGDLVFWTAASGGEYPTLAGIVLDRRDVEGTPLVATLHPDDGHVGDHHRLTDWTVTGHVRARPDDLLEEFLEENPKARLRPRPTR